MFVVVYQWSVKAGSEASFQAAFSARAKEIREQFGEEGSRLHRAEDGSWIAYSQWPDRETWERANRAAPKASASQQAMVECLLSHEMLFCMEVVEDTLP